MWSLCLERPSHVFEGMRANPLKETLAWECQPAPPTLDSVGKSLLVPGFSFSPPGRGDG